MKIAILGSGTTGSIYASYLCSAHDVWMIDRDEEHVRSICRSGLRILHNGEEKIYHPSAVTSTADVGVCDLVILLVKTYQSADALRDVAPLCSPETLALSLQNGLGNEEALLAHFPEDRILLATCSQGGTRLGPGYVRHVGAGPTVIGSISGNRAAEQAVFTAFSAAGIPNLSLSADIGTDIWRKVIINAAINAIAAILRITTGTVVLRNAHTAELCRRVIRESVEVANACGYPLTYEEMLAAVIRGGERNGSNKPSMLQDVEHCRLTEVKQINGAIVEKAEAHGLSAPYNAALLALVSAIEAEYPAQS